MPTPWRYDLHRHCAGALEAPRKPPRGHRTIGSKAHASVKAPWSSSLRLRICNACRAERGRASGIWLELSLFVRESLASFFRLEGYDLVDRL